MEKTDETNRDAQMKEKHINDMSRFSIINLFILECFRKET